MHCGENYARTVETLMPVMTKLAQEISTMLSERVTMEYRPPELLHAAELSGDSSHVFAIRLAMESSAMSWLGRFLGRRTVVLLAIDDPVKRPHQWAYVAVSLFLKAEIRDRILETIAPYVRKEIPADEYRFQIGFGSNFSFISWCAEETRALAW